MIVSLLLRSRSNTVSAFLRLKTLLLVLHRHSHNCIDHTKCTVRSIGKTYEAADLSVQETFSFYSARQCMTHIPYPNRLLFVMRIVHCPNETTRALYRVLVETAHGVSIDTFYRWHTPAERAILYFCHLGSPMR